MLGQLNAFISNETPKLSMTFRKMYCNIGHELWKYESRVVDMLLLFVRSTCSAFPWVILEDTDTMKLGVYSITNHVKEKVYQIKEAAESFQG